MTISRSVYEKDIAKACKFYAKQESRDFQYPNSLNRVQNNFGNSQEMAKGISDLLSLWHQNFYRFGDFDRKLLETCVTDKLKLIKKFRQLNIRQLAFTETEVERIGEIFSGFLDATAGKNVRFTRRSPTAVSKTLNLLAPNCFPLWDEAISQEYGCWWVYSEFGLSEYIKFMRISKQQCIELVSRYSRSKNIPDLRKAEEKLIETCESIAGTSYGPSLLKLIDEYNYAKYTKGWIT